MALYWNAAGLAATRAVEGGSGGYTAHDPNSSASGAYSFLTSTWRTFAPKAGVDINQYPTAAQAPPALQDRVASITPVSNWGGTWAGSRGANAANPAFTQSTPLTPDQISSTGNTGSSGAGPGLDPGSLANPQTNPNDPTIPGTSGNPVAQAGDALSKIGGFAANWIIRGGIAILGIVLIAAAAFHLAKENAPAPVRAAAKVLK